MGSDKALLEIEGTAFISRVANELSAVFTAISIISDRADRYRFLGWPIHEDVFRNCGPLGGIHSALKNAVAPKVFVASCDMPFLDRHLVQRLLGMNADEDVTLFATNDLPQPLCGIYHTRILPVIERRLQQSRLSVMSLLGEVKTNLIQLPSETDAQVLVNINTPTEYSQYCHPGKANSQAAEKR